MIRILSLFPQVRSLKDRIRELELALESAKRETETARQQYETELDKHLSDLRKVADAQALISHGRYVFSENPPPATPPSEMGGIPRSYATGRQQARLAVQQKARQWREQLAEELER